MYTAPRTTTNTTASGQPTVLSNVRSALDSVQAVTTSTALNKIQFISAGNYLRPALLMALTVP
jgi:hypothetical protein